MSMALISVIQMLELFAAYLCTMIAFPAFVFGKTLHLKNRFEKFMVYSVIGNFYVINLVYFLELCHIAYGWTLLLFTVIPGVLLKIKLENIRVKKNVKDYWDTLRKLNGGQLGMKAYKESRKAVHSKRRKAIAKHFFNVYVKGFPEVVMVLVVLAALFYIYGYDSFVNFGYKASDVVVHNYWINSLAENKIFITGVYPYGFHNVIFYISAIFRIDIYIILRLIPFVSTVWTYMMLLCFMKLTLKSRYLPYLGVLVYTLADFFKFSTYARFLSALPQEYGMMFILASIYPLIMYFREQRRTKRGAAGKRDIMYLFIFAMSFSLTFTVHFYGTFITGLFCLAVGLGFIGWFVRRPYFRRVMITGILSCVIAFLPMGLALLFGMKFHGSIAWGMNIINQTEVKPSGTTEQVIPPAEQKLIDEYGETLGVVAYDAQSITNNYNRNVVNFTNDLYTYSFIILPLILLIIGLIILITRHKSDAIYGATIISIGFFMAFMVIMNNASLFHIPGLMDMNRGGIYFSYVLMMGVMSAMDGFLYIVTFTSRRRWAINICSFLCIAGTVAYVYMHGGIRAQVSVAGEELNEAIECVTHIKKDETPFTWTIVSANDERQMIIDKGYHYETIDFLRAMEILGNRGRIRIPTEKVYFFVEKEPVAFFSRKFAGERISEEWADNSLCWSAGMLPYNDENRVVTMSRMYYWCEAFRALYPNEMSIYMETDDFICYKVVQNPYRLFNFSIDYDYNLREYPVETVETEDVQE